jgi:hypothetical protein
MMMIARLYASVREERGEAADTWGRIVSEMAREMGGGVHTGWAEGLAPAHVGRGGREEEECDAPRPKGKGERD